MSYDINEFISSPDLYRVIERRGWSFNDYQSAAIIFLSNAPLQKKLEAYSDILKSTKNVKLANQLSDTIETSYESLNIIEQIDGYQIALYLPKRNGQLFMSYREAYNYAIKCIKDGKLEGNYFKITKGIFDIFDYEFSQVVSSIVFNLNGVAINIYPYASEALVSKWEEHIDKTNERLKYDNDALPAYKNVPFFAGFIKYPKVYKEFEVVEYDHRDPELGYTRYICADFNVINKMNLDLKKQADEKKIMLSSRVAGQPVFTSSINENDYLKSRFVTIDMVNLRRVQPYIEEKETIRKIKELLNQLVIEWYSIKKWKKFRKLYFFVVILWYNYTKFGFFNKRGWLLCLVSTII